MIKENFAAYARRVEFNQNVLLIKILNSEISTRWAGNKCTDWSRRDKKLEKR